ncbi:YitT family protein [Roseibacillus persicicus]|uniref:YitT family protein n=1 Tax=Roseibacillus persicicus TaxID=454148 RepID=UPI00398A66FA
MKTIKVGSGMSHSSHLPHPRVPVSRPLLDLSQILFGCFLAGTSFNVLLRPNEIASGGIVGLSLIFNEVFGVEPAFLQWGFNFLILVIAAKFLGRAFVFRSLAGLIALPAAVYLTRFWPPMTGDLLLGSLAGGAGVGVGMGLVFRANGSVGGFSALALLFHRRLGLPVDRGLILLDGLVLLSAALVYRNAELILAAAICVAIVGRTARGLLNGMSHSRMALIVSELSPEIESRILTEIPLGVTKLHGQGGYSGEEREVLMVVARAPEVMRLKRLVKEVDPNAFMTVCDAHEVLGYGFNSFAVTPRAERPVGLVPAPTAK